MRGNHHQIRLFYGCLPKLRRFGQCTRAAQPHFGDFLPRRRHAQPDRARFGQQFIKADDARKHAGLIAAAQFIVQRIVFDDFIALRFHIPIDQQPARIAVRQGDPDGRIRPRIAPRGVDLVIQHIAGRTLGYLKGAGGGNILRRGRARLPILRARGHDQRGAQQRARDDPLNHGIHQSIFRTAINASLGTDTVPT